MKKQYPILLALVAFVLLSGTIDSTNLFNYANQSIPNYVNLNDKDNLDFGQNRLTVNATTFKVFKTWVV